MLTGSYGTRLTARSLFSQRRRYPPLLPRPLSPSQPPSPPGSQLVLDIHNNHYSTKQNPLLTSLLRPSPISYYSFSVVTLRELCTKTTAPDHDDDEVDDDDSDDYYQEVEPIDMWEEEEDTEPELGDGGDGGGVILQNCPWGERALSIAREILLQFSDDIQLYAFKTSPRGYIYVRLDKMSNEYGCPSMDELESYSNKYKQRLDEVGAAGEIPADLGLEVSSPSAERLLKVPDHLDRFKDLPMRVSYIDDVEGRGPEKNGVFLLDSVNAESGTCTWKLANVKENRDPSAKGRPLSRKQKDWRLELPFSMFKKVALYVEC